MRGGILSGIVLVIVSTCVATGCSSGSNGKTSPSGGGGGSITGYIPFSPAFVDLENDKNDGGVEAYKVEVKLFDHALTCDYHSYVGEYSYIRVEVKDPSHGAIGPGTYTIGASGLDAYVRYYKVSSDGNGVTTIDEADSTQGTITFTSVDAGASVSGSFDVQLTQSQGSVGSGSLSGTFSATVVPLTGAAPPGAFPSAWPAKSPGPLRRCSDRTKPLR